MSVRQEIARVAARVPKGRAGFWEIMLRLDAAGPFSVPMIVDETNVSRGAVDNYVRRLKLAGYLREHGTRPNVGTLIKMLRLTKRPARAPLLRRDGEEFGSARENMWRTIRTLTKGFTTLELAFAASTPEVPVRHRASVRYVSLLNAAGYFTSAPAGRGRERVYRLKPGMNTGPLAPAILKISAVWDRNQRRVMGDDHVAEEAA